MNKIVKVWPKGYADWAGLKSFEVDASTTRDEINVLVSRKFGALAKIYSIQNVTPIVPISYVSEQHARIMSQHDNS